VARLQFRHRIGLLVALAAVALVAVTIVTLVLGRRAERQMRGIETQYVPLLEVDRDLKRLAADVMKAIEDAAGAAELARLDDAARLHDQFLRRVETGRPAIAGNGGDAATVIAAFERYYASARALSLAIIHGKPVSELTPEIEAMRRLRADFLTTLDTATGPDRTRLTAAFAEARASQRESLTIDIIVAACVLLVMGVVSWRLIRRTVRSLQAVSSGVERLAGGDFATPIEVSDGGEIGDLAREANRTAGRLRDYREEVQRQASAAETANKELEAFSYSVSHDLRGPLRSIDGFSQALLEDETERLTPAGLDHLRRIRAAAQRMAELIDDLLRLSRVSRADFHRDKVDLTAMVTQVVADLRRAHPDRTVDVVIQDKVAAHADARLIRITLENLLGNAWKFTSKTPEPRIEFATSEEPEGLVYVVRDNGAGFDMAYVDRLFGAFQRLHTDKEFPGTGIGLATAQRIVRRHGGRIWVEAAVGQGATFRFTLPQPTT